MVGDQRMAPFSSAIPLAAFRPVVKSFASSDLRPQTSLYSDTMNNYPGAALETFCLPMKRSSIIDHRRPATVYLLVLFALTKKIVLFPWRKPMPGTGNRGPCFSGTPLTRGVGFCTTIGSIVKIFLSGRKTKALRETSGYAMTATTADK